jgi:hypothetical protein
MSVRVLRNRGRFSEDTVREYPRFAVDGIVRHPVGYQGGIRGGRPVVPPQRGDVATTARPSRRLWQSSESKGGEA